MPNQKNTDKLNTLKDELSKAKSVIFAEYHGLDANKVNQLRSRIKESGAEFTVAKNTLLKIALDEKKSPKEAGDQLEGPVATIFAYEDAVAPIKALADFAKEFELPTVKGGIIDGEFASAEKINVLSNLPAREELLARLVGTLNSPLSGLVNTLSGNQRKLVYVLSAIAEKRNEEGGV